MATTLRMKPEEARRAGEQLVELATKDKARLQPRLGPGEIEGLTEDVHLLSASSSSALTARAQKKASTQTQLLTAEQLAARVMAVRTAAKRTGIAKDVLKALGVGKLVRPEKVLSVVSAADMVIAAYARYPEALRAAGVLPEDMDTITGIRNALTTADRTQETHKVSSKEQTAARMAVHFRVEASIARILSAAELAFVDDPQRLEMYRAVVPTRPTKKKTPPTA